MRKWIVVTTGLVLLAPACASFQLEERPFYRPQLDLDEISTAQVREYYVRENICRQLRRLAEDRAGAARRATDWGTAVSVIGAAIGVVITSVAQANEGAGDTASVVGLVTAGAGTLSTAIVNLVAPTERTRALVQAAGAARSIEDQANEQMVRAKPQERAEVLNQQVRALGEQCRDARTTISTYYSAEVDGIESGVATQVDSLIKGGRQRSSTEVLERIFERRAREFAPAPTWEAEDTLTRGTVSESDGRDITVPVSAGKCYLFLGAAGFGWDLDGELLDDQGQVVQEDTASDNYPVLRDYCPSADGTVRVRLRQYVPPDEVGERGEAQFRFRAFSRPAPPAAPSPEPSIP